MCRIVTSTVSRVSPARRWTKCGCAGSRRHPAVVDSLATCGASTILVVFFKRGAGRVLSRASLLSPHRSLSLFLGMRTTDDGRGCR